MANSRTRVLFVDDEVNILSSTRRLLRKMRGEWDMSFAESAQAALESMAQEPSDVVVSDMRMPGMNGAELLAETRRAYPDTVRIILSGYATEEALLRAVGPAHNFLSKPCDRETLVNNICRSLKVRNALSSSSLQHLILRIDSLPSLPSAFEALATTLTDEDATPERVAAVVKSDIGMTTKLLQFVNSSYFGLSDQICDPAAAVKMLGLATLKALAATSALFTSAESPLVRDLHDRAYLVGAMARDLARLIPGINEDQACLAAMVHQAGSIVLTEHNIEAYQAVLAEAGATGRPQAEVEREVFGASQAEVGGHLLELWGIPHPVVEAVMFAEQPSSACCDTISPLTVLHIARSLVREAKGDSSTLNEDYLESVGLRSSLPKWREMLLPLASRAA
jgi:HD-like signal output (HDOD) protein